MDWELGLITLYVEICEHYEDHLWAVSERFTNGGYKRCGDEEILTIHLFGIGRGMRDIKSIHKYATAHLKEYFPHVPQYAAYVHRVNRLSEAFRMLVNLIQSKHILAEEGSLYLVDSFPIALAKGQHAYNARVAPGVASKSYNATKKMFYYGVKGHAVMRKREGRLPELEIFILEGAARQDGPMFDQLRQWMGNNLVFADKAYVRPDGHRFELQNDLKVITPTIKCRGQKVLTPEQKVFSQAVSKIRQPIETFFGWLQRKTGIQDAGLVRSCAGLLSHIFAKLAASLISRTCPCFDF